MPVRLGLLCLLVFSSIAAFEGEWASNFGTKTAYRNLIFQAQRFSVPADCRLIALDILFRHGTRFPKRKTILAAERLRAKVAFLRGFPQPIRLQDAKRLAPVGRGEMRALGRRVKQWVTPLPCSVHNCRLVTTSKQRTRESAAEFRKSIGATRTVDVDDNVLRFYDNCPKYQATKERAGKLFEEFRMHVVGPWAETLSARVGLPSGSRLSVGK